MILALLLMLMPVNPDSLQVGDKVCMVWQYGVVPNCHVEYGLIGLQARGLKLVWEREEDGGKAFTTPDKNMILFRR